MNAHHGKEGQQRRGCQYGKHVAEVGRGRHLDVLNHIGIGFPAFQDALFQHHQVFFQQNDIRRFLRHIHSGVHGDSDVCRFHGCGVIDAVAHEAHGMSLLPQNTDHPGLLIRSQFGKHVGVLRSLGQLGIAHLLQVGAQEHIAHLQPYLLADGAGYLVIVACEDFGGNAMLLQRPDGTCRGFLLGVQEGKIANQNHIKLIFCTEAAHRGRVVLLGNPQYPEAFVVQAVHGAQDSAANLLGQGVDNAVILGIGADRQHFLHRTFGYHLGFPGGVLHHCGQTAAGKVKGNFVHLGIGFRQIRQGGVSCFRFFCFADDC